MSLPDDVWCMILRHSPLSRQKAGLALVGRQWARCLAMADSYKEAIGYVNGKVALRQSLRGVRPGIVSLDDLHPNTVEAEVHCTSVAFTSPLSSLVKLVLTFNSHDEYVKLPAATAEMFPQLEELHLDNKGDLHSTDHALEWDLRTMPALKQVACDSLNNTFEWDLHQLPKLQRVFCGSTRMPRLHLPSDCKADLELQLFMQQAAFDPESSSGLEPWSCIRSLHLDRCAPPLHTLFIHVLQNHRWNVSVDEMLCRLWVGPSVIGEHSRRDQRLSLLGSMLEVKHLSVAVHFGDVLAQDSGKLIFPSEACFDSCDIYAMLHGRHAAGNCIGLCEKSLQLPEGWAVRQLACGTPDAPSSAVKGQWKGLDFRYYDPSEQTYVQLHLFKLAS